MQETKYYCDRCKKELAEEEIDYDEKTDKVSNKHWVNYTHVAGILHSRAELCKKCSQLIVYFILNKKIEAKDKL